MGVGLCRTLHPGDQVRFRVSVHDEVWEEGKLVKDYADILALIDPAHGGHEFDIEFLGEHLNRYESLRGCIEHLPQVNAAQERYARMDRADVQRVCEDFLSIL